MLEEGAELGPQDRPDLRTLVGDLPAVCDVALALRRLDVSKEGVTSTAANSSRGAPTFFEQEVENLGDELDEVNDDDAMDSDDEREVLAELSVMDLDEDGCLRVFAALESTRRKTWAENRAIKRKIRTDRLPAEASASSARSSSSTMSSSSGLGLERRRKGARRSAAPAPSPHRAVDAC